MPPAEVIRTVVDPGDTTTRRRRSVFQTLPPQVLDFALSLAAQGRTVVLVSLVLAAVIVVAADDPLAAVLGCGAFVLVQALGNFRGPLPRAATRTRDLARHAVLAALLLLLPLALGPDAPLVLLGFSAACAAPLTFAPVTAGACVAALALSCAAGLALAGGQLLDALTAGLTVAAAGVPITLVLAHHNRNGEYLLTTLDRLEREVASRQQIEDKLRRAQDDLERRVEERTIALTRANRRMEAEIEVRREAERQALEASRIKSAFLANMSHELRTPLNAILGYTEILLEDTDPTERPGAHEDLRKIHGAATHLLALISDILDLSKIEAGKMELAIEPVPLADLLSSVMATVAPLAERNGDTLKLRCSRDLGVIHTDRTKLHQILSNLLSNACKFTRGGRIEVSITTTHDGDRVYYRFEVRDTGIGIAPDVMGRLFSP
ncbi:MAG TPA: histidine kinase dimerization/phospho-acceptor domain-containing protein, partial [Nannocystis sp.]